MPPFGCFCRGEPRSALCPLLHSGAAIFSRCLAMPLQRIDCQWVAIWLVLRSDIGQTALRYGSFRVAIWVVSHFSGACFALRQNPGRRADLAFSLQDRVCNGGCFDGVTCTLSMGLIKILFVFHAKSLRIRIKCSIFAKCKKTSATCRNVTFQRLACFRRCGRCSQMLT